MRNLTNIDKFQQAARKGHLEIIDLLMAITPEENRQAMIHADNDEAFRYATRKGHLDIINRLIKLTPEEQRQAMIHADNDEAFRYAAGNGHLEIINRLIELTPEENRQAMIHANNDYAFRWAAGNGHLDIINLLIELTPEENRQAIIHADNDETFRYAAGKGYLDIINLLMALTPEENRQAIIHANNDSAFRYAAGNGHLDIINLLIELTPEENRQAMIHADNDETFRYAAGKGYLEIINRLIELTPEEQRQAMIHANNDKAFRYAAGNGHLEIIDLLMALTPEENRQAMIGGVISNQYLGLNARTFLFTISDNQNLNGFENKDLVLQLKELRGNYINSIRESGEQITESEIINKANTRLSKVINNLYKICDNNIISPAEYELEKANFLTEIEESPELIDLEIIPFLVSDLVTVGMKSSSRILSNFDTRDINRLEEIITSNLGKGEILPLKQKSFISILKDPSFKQQIQTRSLAHKLVDMQLEGSKTDTQDDFLDLVGGIIKNPKSMPPNLTESDLSILNNPNLAELLQEHMVAIIEEKYESLPNTSVNQPYKEEFKGEEEKKEGR